MYNFDSISNSTNIHELRLMLDQEFQYIQSGHKLTSNEISSLEKVPHLIQELHTKEMNASTR